MTVTATFTGITTDTGSSSTDLITNDTSLTLSGSYTVTSGGGTDSFSIWLTGGEFGVTPFFVGMLVDQGNGTFNWSFTIPGGGTTLDPAAYTVSFKTGVNAGQVNAASGGTSLTSIGTFTVDTSAPVITVNQVTGDDTLSQGESQAGYSVSGTATGADGQTITVELWDETTNTIIATETATVTGGAWTVNFDGNLPIDGSSGDQYSIHASVTDVAGNTGTVNHDFNVESTVCFMPGTQVLTPAGEVSVETLRKGDLVTTTDGRHVPVSWLGRQTVSRIFADPMRVLPIRIKAGALAENVPSRDLLISADHAILIDAMLVQAGALVNGTSIVRETDVPTTYTLYHVEVDDHSLILADNVPSETFVDNVDRLAFDNWDEHVALYPEGKSIVEMAYPRAQSHRQVPRAVRERLAARAAALFGEASESAA
jgi:hypothetical protein